MLQILLIGIGAGAASALLFASPLSGTVLSLPLFLLSGLPVMLAGIAWSHPASLIATGVAGISIGAAISPWTALIYLISIGLPAYILAYLAMLARPLAATNGGAPAVEWYPPGRLVMWAAIIAGGVTIGVVLQFGIDFDTYQKTLRTLFERTLRFQQNIPADQPLTLPGIDDPQKLLDFLVVFMPPAAAVIYTMTSLFNLWIAGRIARASNQLRRPWPDLNAITFPPMAPLVLAGAIALSFFGGIAGLIAAIAMSVFLVAYAVLGFSVLHAITRGMNARMPLLIATWLAVAIIGWPLLIVAILGMTDSIFDLRGRMAARKPPFPPIQPN